MPFTPFHLGPGLVVKAVAGRRFSLCAFGLAQIAMDIEPLIGLRRGLDVLHGTTHTYAAAALIALPVALLTPWLCGWALRRWNRELAHYRLSWLCEPSTMNMPALLHGALAGTLSHVLLDSLMHSDIRPLLPWSDTNPLLGLVSADAIYRGCAIAAAAGALGWLAMAWRRHRNPQARPGIPHP